VTPNFAEHAIKSAAIVGMHAIENVLGSAVALRFERRYPLIVLLALGNQTAQSVERIRF